jgi:hypothetical protein
VVVVVPLLGSRILGSTTAWMLSETPLVLVAPKPRAVESKPMWDPRLQPVLARTCAAPGCTNATVTLTKPRGGGTGDRRYCCFECQQRAYRVRAKRRKIILRVMGPSETEGRS